MTNFVVMNRLRRHLQYLLRHHPCVVMPGIGALVVQWFPAVLSPVDGSICAPRRTLVFNPALTHDDGLLSASIARREGISHDRASQILADELASLTRCLDTDGMVSLGSLGRLTRLDGRRLVFTVGNGAQLCPETYGLETAHTRLTTPNEEIVYPEDERVLHQPRWIHHLRVAAMIAVLLLIGVVSSTPIYAPEPVHKASMAMRMQGPRAAALPHHCIDTLIIPRVNDSLAMEKIDTATRARYQRVIVRWMPRHQTEEEVKESTSEQLTTKTAATGQFLLIVASLDTREKAQRFLNENKGRVLYIWETDGRYRVVAAKDVRRKTLERMARNWPDAWVVEETDS